MRQVRSVVQRHQSPERPILHQISGLMYPKIQRRQVIVNVIHPSSAQCEAKITLRDDWTAGVGGRHFTAVRYYNGRL